MTENKVKIGIIGCGNISGVYFETLQKMNITEVAACADLDLNRARASAEKYEVAKACTSEELLADPEIQIVVNLTIPVAHANIALAALEAGKSIYNEKPLAITREDGRKILELARKKKLLVGCAPDTVLGGGTQTCRKLIDDGWIGEPVSANAFMVCHGHESWHPDPEFYYQAGGGPMFDMGPYYLSSLITLMGPVRRVTGSAKKTFAYRTITSEPKKGTKVKVEVPTHIAGVMDFANGAVATLITSFDVWASELPIIEIHGTEGSLRVPDPNCFGGDPMICRHEEQGWQKVPLTHGYAGNDRGLGVADMAYALIKGRKHRANGEIAYHVLDIMHAFHDASEQGRHVEITSTCTQPAPMSMGTEESVLED